MSFSTWFEFFHMGGYALYVWLSYGVTLTVLSVLVLAPWWRHRRLRRDMARRRRLQQRDKA